MNNPLAAKMNFANKVGGPLKAPPPNNSNQTGISIAKGSYLNTNSSNQQPTWKALINEPQKQFYSNQFDRNENLPIQKLKELDHGNGNKKRSQGKDGQGYYDYGANDDGKGGRNMYQPSYGQGRKHG